MHARAPVSADAQQRGSTEAVAPPSSSRPRSKSQASCSRETCPAGNCLKPSSSVWFMVFWMRIEARLEARVLALGAARASAPASGACRRRSRTLALRPPSTRPRGRPRRAAARCSSVVAAVALGMGDLPRWRPHRPRPLLPVHECRARACQRPGSSPARSTQVTRPARSPACKRRRSISNGSSHPGVSGQRLLHGVLGLQPRPAVIEALGYLAYAAAMLLVVLRPRAAERAASAAGRRAAVEKQRKAGSGSSVSAYSVPTASVFPSGSLEPRDRDVSQRGDPLLVRVERLAVLLEGDAVGDQLVDDRLDIGDLPAGQRRARLAGVVGRRVDVEPRALPAG